MQRTKVAFVSFLLAVPLCSVADIAPLRQTGIQHEFARKLTVIGVPDLGEVTPMLYRGSQPTKEGFEQLAEMRIDIVVDLRGNRKAERDIVTALGMQYVPIPWFCLRPMNIVIAQFLNFLRENPGKKIYVHCNTGIDRTGMVV